MKQTLPRRQTIWQLCRQNWIIICIVLVAALLRTWQLESKAIFFGDAARDVLVAAEALKNHELPLLGIPSRMPEFKQGPVSIWIAMATMALVGENLFVISLVFAVISILSVILVYEVVTIFLDRKSGLVAAWLVATSPLAIAHGRMPYHTNPIPLAGALFLWAVMRLWHQKKWSLFWAVLAWCFLFQFELALLPIVLVIPFVLWRTGQRWQPRWVGEIIAGSVIGLLPQIIYDLTHNFSQLGRFGAWVGYRLGTAVVPGADYAFGFDNIRETAIAVWTYGGRLASVEAWSVVLIMGGLLVWSGGTAIKQLRQQRLPPLVEVTWLSTLVLLLGFVIHSTPSEAYFPIFVVLIPILLAYGVFQFKDTAQRLAIALVIAVGVLNIFSVVQANYFVGSASKLSYGAGTQEQLAIVLTVERTTGGSFFFTTIQPAGVFPSTFDNLRWWLRQQGLTEDPNGVAVFIEPKDSSLDSYPGVTKQQFESVDVYYYE